MCPPVVCSHRASHNQPNISHNVFCPCAHALAPHTHINSERRDGPRYDARRRLASLRLRCLRCSRWWLRRPTERRCPQWAHGQHTTHSCASGLLSVLWPRAPAGLLIVDPVPLKLPIALYSSWWRGIGRTRSSELLRVARVLEDSWGWQQRGARNFVGPAASSSRISGSKGIWRGTNHSQRGAALAGLLQQLGVKANAMVR